MSRERRTNPCTPITTREQYRRIVFNFVRGRPLSNEDAQDLFNHLSQTLPDEITDNPDQDGHQMQPRVKNAIEAMAIFKVSGVSERKARPFVATQRSIDGMTERSVKRAVDDHRDYYKQRVATIGQSRLSCAQAFQHCLTIVTKHKEINIELYEKLTAMWAAALADPPPVLKQGSN